VCSSDLGSDAKRVSGETQCRFCKAKTDCPAIQEGLALAVAELPVGKDFSLPPDPADLSPQQQAKLLDNIDGIKKWLSNFEDFSANHLLGGGQIPGYKVVHGRRMLKWGVTEEEVKKQLLKTVKLKKAFVVKTKTTLLTPKQVTEAVKKNDPDKAEQLASLYSGLTIVQPGKPKVVDVDDEREPVHPIFKKLNKE
jgi:hypothetical protein